MLIAGAVEINSFNSGQIADDGEGRILVVDDDPRVVETIKLVLERLGGYHVLVARSGPECLRLTKEERPDLILLDIHMPGMDGLGVLRQLRDRQESSAVPVLMVSVDAQLGRMAACFEAGASGFLIKPFDSANLYRQVRSAITQHQVSMLQLGVIR